MFDLEYAMESYSMQARCYSKETMGSAILSRERHREDVSIGKARIDDGQSTLAREITMNER